MLSKREQEIIEIEGFIELAEEIFEELIYKKAPLDEFEETLLRATIDELDELKKKLIILKKGQNK
ncbi:MAG: hypothetical protein AB8G86_08210 [Saprospiraceae bacterium]